jgi:hypothetical protein
MSTAYTATPVAWCTRIPVRRAGWSRASPG